MGRVRMVETESENAGRVVKIRNAAGRGAETGRFVLWQMAPGMWNLEMAVGGSKVHSGCNGTLVWRHTPSSTGAAGARAARGPVRPLRRALQVYDGCMAVVHVCAFIISLVPCQQKLKRPETVNVFLGPGSVDHGAHVCWRAVRWGDGDERRRGLLHPEAVRRSGDPQGAQCRFCRGYQACHVWLLQPEDGPSRPH
jgi:hypothetical protein